MVEKYISVEKSVGPVVIVYSSGMSKAQATKLTSIVRSSV